MSQNIPQQVIRNEAAKDISYYTPAQIPVSGSAVTPQPDGTPIPKLFQPLKIRGLEVQNRIWLSPLCQYSSEDGHQTFWHYAHLGGILSRGAGLITIEATAVTPEGRITPEDAGLWKDSQIEPLRKTIEFAHSQGQKIGIQIGHAGRKASMVAPWLSRGAVAEKEVGGWPDNVVGPSDTPYSDDYNKPRALTLEEISELKDAYVSAFKRSLAAGVDFIEIHNAHGYLLHSFLSPVTNKRTDKYGGSWQNRTRLTLEIVDLARSIIPESMPLFLRISGSDGLEHLDEPSWTANDTAQLAVHLAQHGVDVLDISGYALDPRQKMPSGDAYQAALAYPAKKAVGDSLLVTSVGTIRDGKTANKLLEEEGLDAVFVGRWFQRNPGLVWQFAEELNVQINVAHQIAWAFQGHGGARK